MKITIEGGIYFASANVKYHEPGNDGDDWYRKTFPLYEFHPSTDPTWGDHTHFVRPFFLHADIPEDFDYRPLAVKALEAKRKKLHEQFAAAVMEIDQRINSLLALEA